MRSQLLIGASLVVLMTATPVLAGFQWIPPVEEIPVVEEEIVIPVVEPQIEDAAPMVKDMEMAVPLIEPMAPVPVAVDVVEGFAVQVPLLVALRQIIPEQYEIAFDPDINLTSPVSWQGGKPWREILEDVLTPLDLAANEEDVVLYIQPTEAAIAAMAEPVDVAEAPVIEPVDLIDATPPVIMSSEKEADEEEAEIEEEVFDLISHDTNEVVMVLQSLPDDTRKSWQVERGKTLRELLENWGENANWVVVWDSDRDYLLQSSVTFEGSFEKAAARLVKAFAKARPPLTATFYKNRTLVVQTLSNGEVN
ncbi:MAG: toxin co-regulated pilus biosynthesis Q family protein [Pseudomonadota bacterium]|nr:toxin co-regulated pilus biosynthesis Q family protein [Pseudomonadota bacterium]